MWTENNIRNESNMLPPRGNENNILLPPLREKENNMLVPPLAGEGGDGGESVLAATLQLRAQNC